MIQGDWMFSKSCSSIPKTQHSHHPRLRSSTTNTSKTCNHYQHLPILLYYIPTVVYCCSGYLSRDSCNY